MKFSSISFVGAVLVFSAFSLSAQSQPNPNSGSKPSHSAQSARGQGDLRPALNPDAVFDRMDTNKDGSISRSEFRVAHEKLHARRGEFMKRRQEMKQP